MSDISIEVLPLTPSGNLSAHHQMIPEPFTRRVHEIAESVAIIADQFKVNLGEALDRQRKLRNDFELETVSLELGITLKAECGVIVRGSGEGSLRVSLLWHRRGEADDD